MEQLRVYDLYSGTKQSMEMCTEACFQVYGVEREQRKKVINMVKMLLRKTIYYITLIVLLSVSVHVSLREENNDIYKGFRVLCFHKALTGDEHIFRHKFQTLLLKKCQGLNRKWSKRNLTPTISPERRGAWFLRWAVCSPNLFLLRMLAKLVVARGEQGASRHPLYPALSTSSAIFCTTST